MPDSEQPMTSQSEEEEVEKQLAFAKAALAVAGHEVTDPVLLMILEREARGELTGDEAIAAIRQHVQGS